MSIGYGLNEVLDGKEVSVSETDLVGDIHSMAATLEAFLRSWERSDDLRRRRVSSRLVGIVSELSQATKNKYSVVDE